MKLGPHFEFSKKQRNGVYLLLLVILILQTLYYLAPFSTVEDEKSELDFKIYQKALDSLKLVEKTKSRPMIAPFNPNYLTDYRGYILGMSNEEIDRVLNYRSKNLWINSAKQFQEVSQVSDSLLEIISEYFKFPEFVTNPRTSKTRPPDVFNSNSNSPVSRIDINSATREELIAINGIGEKLAERILNYKGQQRYGFISMVELNEIYGLSPEVIERVKERFYASPPPNFETINLNSATRDQLVTIKYIDYEIAHRIIEYRTLHEGFKSLDELTKVRDFPINKIDLIKVYLRLE